MLSMEQCKIINEQLAKENASEFVKMLLVLNYSPLYHNDG